MVEDVGFVVAAMAATLVSDDFGSCLHDVNLNYFRKDSQGA